ncbi:unnamed protein product [Closterium sp. Yama58-4]|nr:unnamed protein product [Closterium sp. Yama58-4]
MVKDAYLGTVDWILWAACGSDPESALAALGQSGASGVCGAVWGASDIAYRCRTCEHDPTCAICVPCFLDGDHEGHDYAMIKTGGGCCDCGDPTAWKRQGFCKKHPGPGHAPPLPETFVARAEPVLAAVAAEWQQKIVFAARLEEERSGGTADSYSTGADAEARGGGSAAGYPAEYPAEHAAGGAGARRAHQWARLLDILLDILLGTLQSMLQGALGRDGRIIVSCGSGQLSREEVRNGRVTDDIRYVLSHSASSRHVTARRPDLLRAWLRQLAAAQGMCPHVRRTTTHVAIEPDDWSFAYLLEAQLATVNPLLAEASAVPGLEAWKEGRQVEGGSGGEKGGGEKVGEKLVEGGGFPGLGFGRRKTLRWFVDEGAGQHAGQHTGQQAGQQAGQQQGQQQGNQSGQAGMGHGSVTAAGETIPGDEGWGGVAADLDATTSWKAEGFDPEAYVDDWGATETGTHTYLPPRAREIRQVAARFGVPPALVRLLHECAWVLARWVAVEGLRSLEASSVSKGAVGGAESVLEWPVVEYDVGRQEVSFHLPLHRMLALLLHSLLRLSCPMPDPQGHPQEDSEQREGTGGMISAGMWRRNGQSMVALCDLYHSVHWCEDSLELDLFLLQCAAVSAPPDAFVRQVVARYSLTSYFSLTVGAASE